MVSSGISGGVFPSCFRSREPESTPPPFFEVDIVSWGYFLLLSLFGVETLSWLFDGVKLDYDVERAAPCGSVGLFPVLFYDD